MDVPRFIGQVVLFIIAIAGMAVFISEGSISLLLNPEGWTTRQGAYVIIAAVIGFSALGILNRSRG